MFEVGFSELVMIGLVSLLVIGPERLPKVARLAGFWLGRTQKMVAGLKAEIRQELHAEEIRQALQEQAGFKDYQQLLDEVSETADDIKASIGDLPEAAKEAVEQEVQPGFWLGRTQKMVAGLKTEIRQELNAEEIRQALQEQAGFKGYQQLLDEVSETADDIKASIGDLPEVAKEAVGQEVQQYERK